MSLITVTTTGNGYAYVDVPDPYDGQTVTLYCVPDAGETLDDVTARDYQGYAIALATVQQQTFNFNAAWGFMYIDVVFSGSPTPPVPPKPKRRKRMPIWLYPCLRR